VTVCCGTCDRPLPGVPNDESLGPRPVKVIETMRLAGVRVPYRAIGVERAWKVHDWQVARLLRSRAGEFDVVHTWPSGALMTLRAAREVGVKTFLERPNTHTGYAYEIVRRECERLGLTQVHGACHTSNPRRLRLEEEEFQTADRLLCPSDFVARTFIERGYPPGQIARHRYGCDLARFTASGAREAERGGLRVAFVGTCEPRKGLHLALRAWVDSPASRDGAFSICGRFVPGYRELLASLLAHPSVRELGFQADVAAVMADADVLVLPTLEEGSALVTYEARACGCVLLVSEAAGALAEDGVNALVHPVGDVATLGGQMTMLAGDRALLNRLRERSLAERQTLTWSAAASELVARYWECLKPVTPTRSAVNDREGVLIGAAT